MSRLFFDRITGAPTTVTCVIRGHQSKSGGFSDGYYWDEIFRYHKKNHKGFVFDRYRHYFAGELIYCGVVACKWHVFKTEKRDKKGRPIPYRTTKIIDGIERELGEPDHATQTQPR